MYIPSDSSSYGDRGGAGRTFFGLSVKSGQPVANGLPGNGGTPPQLQNSANIRVNRTSNGRMQLYSYHLNRSDANRHAPGASEPYLTIGPDGKPRRNVPYYHYGDGKNMQTQWPENQWFTMCLDIVMNGYDANGKALANGLSRLTLYDNSGRSLGTAEYPNAVYSRDPSGYVSGIQFDEKWDSETGNKGAESNTYYRNYQVFLPDTSRPGCGG